MNFYFQLNNLRVGRHRQVEVFVGIPVFSLINSEYVLCNYLSLLSAKHKCSYCVIVACYKCIWFDFVYHGVCFPFIHLFSLFFFYPLQDLARSLAINCLVFNCSDDLDYISMGQFFSGVAASGSWACFDEFNRLEVSTGCIGVALRWDENILKQGGFVMSVGVCWCEVVCVRMASLGGGVW